ncbi:MAG: NAD(P)/FAD-dependent oxidoreductase [Micropepsaceae bacterium]
MERYDAVIIGAGADGLIAAHKLASAGLKVLVVERQKTAGGCAQTREFHSGFMASPYADELAPIPSKIFRQMDLPRHGAIFMPAPASTCLSAAGTSVIYGDEARMARVAGKSGPALVELFRELNRTRAAIAERAGEVQPRSFLRLARLNPLWPRPQRRPWPGEVWGRSSLADALNARLPDSNISLHLAAHVLSGSAASPTLMGTALHLLRGLKGSGQPRGGLGSLAGALEKAARTAGAEIRLQAEVSDIRLVKGTTSTLVLSGGEEISCRAMISTLDLKTTFLDLVAWSDLPPIFAKRVTQFRMTGARARVLFALDALPEFDFAQKAREAALGPIHITQSLTSLSQIHDKWRAGMLAEQLPVTLRVPSLIDPSLAPIGKAVMTATICGVPSTLADGDWNADKRAILTKIALSAAERAAPGIAGRVIAAKTIVAKDFETELGWSAGDAEGGELTPDQALGFRPFPEWQDGRTALRGLYLGGPSAAPSPFFLGAGGAHAAAHLMADLKSRALR